MTERITAVLDRIEAEQQTPALPQGIGALALLQMAYRGAVRLTPQQMRAAMAALPFEAPKLSAVSVGYFTGDNFAAQLEQQIRYSQHRLKLIEVQPVAQEDDARMGEPAVPSPSGKVEAS